MEKRFVFGGAKLLRKVGICKRFVKSFTPVRAVRSFKTTDSESNESGGAISPLNNALITCVLYGRDSLRPLRKTRVKAFVFSVKMFIHRGREESRPYIDTQSVISI